MNSTNNGVTAGDINSIIQQTYENDIYLWSLISSLTLICYAILLKLPQEIEYIWFKSFSLPTFLFIIARYAPLIYQGLYFSLNIVSTSVRTCNMLIDVVNCMTFLGYIGVQGLLVARAYSICRGDKKIATALVFGFLSGLILDLYEIVAYSGCDPSSDGQLKLVLATNISVIFTDLLVFGICMWTLRDIWKLKKEAGIQSGFNLVSVLFAQSISRCCFVIVITIADAVISTLIAVNVHFSLSMLLAAKALSTFQNSLSAILMADFTLDLRRLNDARIEASQVSLPTLQFSNVLQHAHQSLLVELATPEDTNAEHLEGNEDDSDGHDNPPGSVDDIQPAEW